MSLRVGRRIRQRREELGIRTQRELADLIPSTTVTNQTINKWEQGANEPTARYKAMLAEALDVDVAYFIAEEPKGATPDLSKPATADLALVARLDAFEALIAKQNELLERQSEILASIEERLAAEKKATADARESTRRLLDAVDDASRVLGAGSQRAEEEPSR